MEPNKSNQGFPNPQLAFSGALFGLPKATQQSSSQQAPSIFTNNANQTSIFSPHNAANAFSGLFGGNKTPSTGLFGQPNNATTNQQNDTKTNQPNIASQTPLFGGALTPGQPKLEKSSNQLQPNSSIFGGTPNPNKASEGGLGSIFGQSKDDKKPLFGAPSSEGLFGSKKIQNPQISKKQGVQFSFSKIAQTPQKKQETKPPQVKSTFQTGNFGLFGNANKPQAQQKKQQKKEVAPSTSTTAPGAPIFSNINKGTTQFKLTPSATPGAPPIVSFASLDAPSKTQKKQDIPKESQGQKMKQVSLFGKTVLPNLNPTQKQQTTSPFSGGLFNNSTTPSVTTQNKKQNTNSFGKLFGQQKSNDSQPAKTQIKITSLQNEPPKAQGAEPAKQKQGLNPKVQTGLPTFQLTPSNPQKKQEASKTSSTNAFSAFSFNNVPSVAPAPGASNQKKQTEKVNQTNKPQLTVPQKLTKNTETPTFKFQLNKPSSSTPQNKPPASSPIKPTTEQMVFEDKPKQKGQVIETQKRKIEGRNRLPTFDARSRNQRFMNDYQNKEKQQYIPINKLADLLSIQQQSHIIQSSQKICNTFRKYLSIYKNTNNASIQYQPIQFIKQIQANKGINKFINDFTLPLASLYSAHPQSYQAIGSLFYDMLKQLKYDTKIFNGYEMNAIYFQNNRIYKILDADNILLDWENATSLQLVCEFIKYFSANVSQVLRKLENSVKNFKKTELYELVLQKSLLMNFRCPDSQPDQIVQGMKLSDYRQMTHLTRILNNLIQSKQFAETTQQIISKKCIVKLIPLVDDLQACSATKIFQKVLLKVLNLQKYQNNASNAEILNLLQKTTSKIFLPFRVILSKLDKNRKKLSPYQKQLLEQINGSQWSAWLNMYLSEQKFDQKQANYFVEALKSLKIKEIDQNQILGKNSQIKIVIHSMRNLNLLKNFYQSITSLISTKESIERVQKQFLKQDRILNQELRQVANQIRKFPNCQLTQEDIPQMIGKTLYFLKTLIIMPERAFRYENAFFDVMGFMDVDSERCDRVCHLVIDILAYFSLKNFDEQIISKCFQAIISLLQTNQTKRFMNLAMNINSPLLEFFNKKLPRSVLQKICSFLTHLLISTQFYDSTRIANQASALINAYMFRYVQQKYLSFTETFIPTIPLYWFSSCLKMSINQSYSSQLLSLMLTKLKIHASKYTASPSSYQTGEIKKMDVPLILSSIVDACNFCNFQKTLQQKIQAKVYFVRGRFFLANRMIAQGNESSAQSQLYESLNLLKTMIQLRKIRNIAIKQNPNHFVSTLLLNLSCLSELDRHFISSKPNQFQFLQRKSIPAILSLMALISEQYPAINCTNRIKTQWLYNEQQNIDLDQIRRLHEKYSKTLDYNVINDPLVHPYGYALYSYQTVGSLAMWCLKEILEQVKDARIQELLYMVMPRANNQLIVEGFDYVKTLMIENYSKCLLSGVPNHCRNAWELLVSFASNPLNKGLSRQAYRIYMQFRPKQYKGFHPLLSISKFLRSEIQFSQKTSSLAKVSSTFSANLQVILSILQQVSKRDLSKFFEQYRTLKKYRCPQSLNQFQRVILQRKIIQNCESYEILTIMQEILLKMLYQGSSIPNFTRACQAIIDVICQTQVTKLCNFQSKQSKMKDLRKTQKCDMNIPRLYGPDVLQIYILKPELQRQDLLQIQIENVMDWYSHQIEQFSIKFHQFFQVILSIDQTYFSNHAIKPNTFKPSQLFCQHHLPAVPYKALSLFGVNPKASIAHLKCIQNDLFDKVKLISNNKNNTFNYNQQMLRCLQLCNALFLWFRNNYEEAQKNYYCKEILKICFNWLGELTVVQPITAKLLLDVVKTSYADLNPDNITKIKQTILKTITSTYIYNLDLKQQILTLFLLVPPEKTQSTILQFLANIWKQQQNNQYFYSQSRLVYKLCQLHPIQMAKHKILTKCDRIRQFQQSSLQNIRYSGEDRTIQNKSWLWVLKIVVALMQNGMQSTLVVHQVSKFVQNNKKRIIFTLNEIRQDISLRNKTKQFKINLHLAQLDQLQATLQLFVILSQSKMWVEMNRQFFQQMLYYLMHRTIVLFAMNSSGQKLGKMYIPVSQSQKIIWKLTVSANEFVTKQQMTISEGYDPDRIEQEYIATTNFDFRPNVFVLAMSIRYNECLKLWLLACSSGIRNSCFVKQYFSRPISQDQRGSNLKYGLTHWDHLNNAITDIVKGLTQKIKDWGKWQSKKQLLSLMNDAFTSPQFFIESGYIYTLAKLPQNQEQLISGLGQTLCLALQMSGCHLATQIFFRNMNGGFSKQTARGFQEKIFRQCQIAEQKLIQNKIDKENPIFEQILYEKSCLSQIKCD